MTTINFAGMTGVQAFYAIDKDGGVTDSDISANMEAWALYAAAQSVNQQTPEYHGDLIMNKGEPHPCAILLRWIADNEEIELKQPDGSYHTVNNYGLLAAIPINAQYATHLYRIKPKTVRVGKYDITAPIQKELPIGTEYWAINQINSPLAHGYTWDGDAVDMAFLQHGMCWLNKEDAALAAKAIRELLTGQ